MRPNEFRERLRGILPVQYCPYTKEGEVDIEGWKKNTKFLVGFAEGGKKDVVLVTNGSTAECYANSVEEQERIIEIVVSCSGNLPVIAGVSQPGTKETIKMAQYAQEVGVDCVMVVPPYYTTPTNEGMHKHFKAIAGSVSISVMIYNNPAVSGALLSCDLMQELAKIDNIVAVKDNSPSASHYAEMAANIPTEDMILISGLGEMAYLGSAAYGYKYKGFATFIANFAPGLAYEIYEAVRDRDFEKAYEALRKELPIWDFIKNSIAQRNTPSIIPTAWRGNPMYISIGKAAMDLVGLNGGESRLPLVDITSEEKSKLRKILSNMGVL